MTTPTTTIPELEALPVGSVVLDMDGDAWQRGEDGWTCTDRASNTVDQPSSSLLIYAPLTILWPIPEPTVKPGRDAVLAALLSVEAGPSTNDLADAVLAILPGRSEADVRAGALRDAAEAAEDVIHAGDTAELVAFPPGTTGLGQAITARDSLYEEVPTWLRERADEEAGK